MNSNGPKDKDESIQTNHMDNGYSKESFYSIGEENVENRSVDNAVSDSNKKAISGSSRNSFNEKKDDKNGSEVGAVLDSETFRLLGPGTSVDGTSDGTAKNLSSCISFSEEEDNSEDNAISDSSSSGSIGCPNKTFKKEVYDGNSSSADSERFRFVEAGRIFGLRGGGGGSNSTSLENNSGSSKEKRRSSLVTPTFRYDRQKPDNLFPPTKKYRYYPVTCEYCGKRFQPNKLKAHQRKHHLSETEEVKSTKKVQSVKHRQGHETPPSTSKNKSAGAVPRQLQVCYICGQFYGSRSLKIHEPKCLDKWRIQNQQLPPDLRAAEPVKPEPMESVGTGKEGYNVPAFDPNTEAAYRSHLSTLIPCRHCSRTFSPHRIQKHMSCCIERSRTRESATPARGRKSKK